ncbi:MAG TPA: fluoride efflux transporter CrcB [Segeticoccus sp.]|nr:fluoride efflux transporter CrcB [Segeticoccus sp.]
MSLLLVALGAAVGAPLRYLTDRAVQARGGLFPWGTLLVNVVGSLVLGVVVGATSTGALSHRWGLLLGTGLCGALTTYSTFSYETLRLAQEGARLYAVANLLGTVVTGVAAAFAGYPLGRLLGG